MNKKMIYLVIMILLASFAYADYYSLALQTNDGDVMFTSVNVRVGEGELSEYGSHSAKLYSFTGKELAETKFFAFGYTNGCYNEKNKTNSNE